MTRQELVAQRRRHLVAQCQWQRADLARQLQPLGHTLDAAHTGLRILQRVRRHPGWLAAFATGLYLLKPRRLSAAMRTASQALRICRTLAPQLQAVRARLR